MQAVQQEAPSTSQNLFGGQDTAHWKCYDPETHTTEATNNLCGFFQFDVIPMSITQLPSQMFPLHDS